MTVFEIAKTHTMKNIQWSAWVNQIYSPFKNVPLKLLSGKIPSDLNGKLYRNHTSCQIRDHQRCGHLYDGDGSILKIDINKGNALATYEYIKTKSYEIEEKEQKFTHYSWGINPKFNPQKILKNIQKLGKLDISNIKNTANASIFKFPNLNNEALALGFHGLPYKFDLDTLETIGEFSFDKLLQQNDTLGLNFKVDYQNKCVYNFAYSQARYLKLFKYDFDGNVIQHKQHNLDFNRILIQDFCVAGDYIIFLISPQNSQFLKNPFSKKTFWDSIKTERSEGTQILIYNKDTLEFVSENTCDAFLTYQLVNGITNKKGKIEIDFLMYTDFKINKSLSSVVKEERIDESGFSAKIHRMAIDPNNGIIQKSKKRCEYPSCNPIIPFQDQGIRWGDTYFNVNKQKKEYDIANTVAKLDNQNNYKMYTQFSKNTYLGQPILSQNQKYLLTVGINCDYNQNELHIIDTQNMEQVGVLEIPMLLPFSFQGMWLDF